MRISPPAAVALSLYVGISLVVGEVFPFSRYAMYAAHDGYERSAVIRFRADGIEGVEVEAFTGFSGIDEVGFPPERCSMGWRLHEANHWIDIHPAPEGETGPVTFEIGYVVVGLSEDGPAVLEPFTPMQTGRAWPAAEAP